MKNAGTYPLLLNKFMPLAGILCNFTQILEENFMHYFDQIKFSLEHNVILFKIY